MNDAGAFEPQHAYYLRQAIILTALLALSVAILFVADSLWLRLLDSALLAFVFVQIGFIFHDTGHRQIFARAIHNDIAMMLAGFIVGSSRSWWFDSHNRHHTDPNDMAKDPDTELYVVNFSEEQARRRSPFLRPLTQLQHYYFFPVLALEGIGVHIVSISYLIRMKSPFRLIEAVGLAVHFVVYFGLLLYVMPAWQVGVFALVHHCLAGLYMGTVFAPNHKGMLIPDANSNIDLFHRQILTSRNILPSALIDTWYGGLNYQIEHHLFPKIARNKLKVARPIVQAYCRERGISYAETGMWQSFVEITRHLQRVSATQAKAPRARTSPAVSD